MQLFSCLVVGERWLRVHFHHFLNKFGVAVMLLVFFPVWLAARASKSEVFRTNYRPHAGVITSSSAHLIICLPPVGPPLTIGCTEAKENCISHQIHNISHPSLLYRFCFQRANMETSIQRTGCRPRLTGFDHPLETRSAASSPASVLMS